MKTILGLSIAAAITALAAFVSASQAQAAWGCLAQNRNGVWGRSWSMDTEGGARREALAGCKENLRPGESACHIVACDPHIDTHEDAARTWPKTNCKTNCL